MEGIDYVELERRLQLNQAESEGISGPRDLGVRETLLFIATIVVIVLSTLLWRQL